MSAALISFIVRRDKIGLPPSLVKPWKETDPKLLDPTGEQHQEPPEGGSSLNQPREGSTEH